MSTKNEILSIGELLEHLGVYSKKQDSITWKLAIPQRSFEWDETHVTNLVDSLLRGFPIGTILICDTKEAYYELNSRDKLRKAILKGEKITRQILDGQQRCVSILSTFTNGGLHDQESGKKKHLWINVLLRNPEAKEFDEKRGQRYLFHWSSISNLNKLSFDQKRNEKLPIKSLDDGWVCFYKLVSFVTGKSSEFFKQDDFFEKTVLHFNIQATPEQTEVFKQILKRIRKTLNEKTIPIHSLHDDDIEDLHQVFIRINAAGMPLGPVDAFFAGVKKYWSHAEEHLRRIVGKASIFKREHAITLLARCAGMSLNEKDNPFDPYRIGLRQLTHGATNRHYPLIVRMGELTPMRGTNSFINAVKWITKVAREQLFFTSTLIHPSILMPVVAWAYRYDQNYGLPSRKNSRLERPIIAFLFWTQVFGSHQYGRGKFDRETFKLGWDTGENGDAFPWFVEDLQQICFDYDRIKPKLPQNPHIQFLKSGSTNAQKIFDLTAGNKSLFLSLCQKIPFNQLNIDWDHLIAYNFARNRFKIGRKVNWDHMYWVSQIGNFSGIDAHANRMFGDKPPSEKFPYYTKNIIRANPFLNEEDIIKCQKVEQLLKEKKKDTAAEVLYSFVANRTFRIWRETLRQIGAPPQR
ncbi:DUF262 domain-containing protein [candidate division WOR-3 bacterium]|nr:DUF262 domain-containing protein [candidate division WOR-3 bacterium]